MYRVVRTAIKNPIIKRGGYILYLLLLKLPMSDKVSLMFTDSEGNSYYGTFHDFMEVC